MTFEQENYDNSACRNDEDVDATTTNNTSTIRNGDMAIRITRPSFSASLECITEDHQTDYMCLTPSETNNNNNNYKNIKNAKYIRKGATPPPRRCQRITNLPPDWPPTEGKANRSLSAPNLPSSVSLRQRQASTRRSLRQASNNSLPEALHKKTSINASFSSLCSDRHNGIQHSALNINNIMTWVSFILPACKDNSDTVILVIPGNPGAIEFYDRFIEHLFDKCNLPIFGISHAGEFNRFRIKGEEDLDKRGKISTNNNCVNRLLKIVSYQSVILLTPIAHKTRWLTESTVENKRIYCLLFLDHPVKWLLILRYVP